jgi:hypothetical protein
VRVGAPVGALRARVKPLATGILVGPRLSGGRRFVYGVSNGRVRYAAIVSRSETGNPALLRSDLRAAGL